MHRLGCLGHLVSFLERQQIFNVGKRPTERPLRYGILNGNSAALRLTDLLRGNTLQRLHRKVSCLPFAEHAIPFCFVLPSLLVVDDLPPGLGSTF